MPSGAGVATTAFGAGEGKAMDRASQAEVKYREALEDALRAAREHGDASAQAVAAWDVVDEIEVRRTRDKNDSMGSTNVTNVFIFHYYYFLVGVRMCGLLTGERMR